MHARASTPVRRTSPYLAHIWRTQGAAVGPRLCVWNGKTRSAPDSSISARFVWTELKQSARPCAARMVAMKCELASLTMCKLGLGVLADGDGVSLLQSDGG